MPDFKDRLTRHAEHIKNVCNHCTTEETTKQALILPLLDENFRKKGNEDQQ